MNKFQREIELLIKRNDKLLEQELKKAYNQSIKELKFIVNDYMSKYADLNYSEKLQATRYYSLMLQIEDELDILNKQQENHIFHFLDSVGELGYNELFYDFEMSNNLNVNFTMLSKEVLNTIVQTPVANFKLSERLKDGVIADLKGNLNEVLFRGFRNGWSYQKMAQQLVEKGNSSQKRALTIARTEGGRVSAVTRQRSQEYAKSLGIETEKQWVSTLDGETRETHRKLDGQLQPIDGYFTVSGHKAKQPHMFGVAAEDVNCRCRTITKIKEYDYSERRDNITKKVSNYQNYDEWYKDKGFQEIEDKKLKNSYNKYKDILKSDMPTFDKFKEMKYNGGSEWEQINRQFNTISEIRNKQWNKSFKEKTLKLYNDFYSNGLEFSSHSLGRYAQRTDLTVEDAVSILSKNPNYLQEDGRKIWFYDGHAFIKNQDETEIVTYIYRKNKNPKGGDKPWKLIK